MFSKLSVYFLFVAVKGVAVSVRRFNVTVISGSGTDSGSGSSESVSPVPRHRGQPFASIPEDHALDDHEPQQNSVYQQNVSGSRCASPAPSWDFSLDESSDSVSLKYFYTHLSHIYCIIVSK